MNDVVKRPRGRPPLDCRCKKIGGKQLLCKICSKKVGRIGIRSAAEVAKAERSLRITQERAARKQAAFDARRAKQQAAEEAKNKAFLERLDREQAERDAEIVRKANAPFTLPTRIVEIVNKPRKEFGVIVIDEHGRPKR